MKRNHLVFVYLLEFEPETSWFSITSLTIRPTPLGARKFESCFPFSFDCIHLLVWWNIDAKCDFFFSSVSSFSSLFANTGGLLGGERVWFSCCIVVTILKCTYGEHGRLIQICTLVFMFSASLAISPSESYLITMAQLVNFIFVADLNLFGLRRSSCCGRVRVGLGQGTYL